MSDPRPEMLSDRLGYPRQVGDADWTKISAAREAEQPTTGQPWTEADVERLGQAMADANTPDAWIHAQIVPMAHFARVVLDALAAAGRLLPEGTSHERRYMVKAISDDHGTQVQWVADPEEAGKWVDQFRRWQWPRVEAVTWQTWTTRPVPINEESTERGVDHA